MLTPVENPRAYGLVETDARRQRPAVPREAGRQTRSPATRSTPASTCSSRTRSTASRRTRPGRSSAATSRRSSSAARRSSPTSTTATGSTSARPRSTCRCTATSWTAAIAAPPFDGAGRAGVGRRPARASKRASRSHGPVLHRRGRRRQGRRARRALLASSAGRRTSTRRAVIDGVDPLAERLDRPRGAPSAARSSAATATSAGTRRSSAGRARRQDRRHRLQPAMTHQSRASSRPTTSAASTRRRSTRTAARAIGRGFVAYLKAKRIAVVARHAAVVAVAGARRSSRARATQGADVVDYGMMRDRHDVFRRRARRPRRRRADHRVAQPEGSTTASRWCGREAFPLSGDAGIGDIRDMIDGGTLPPPARRAGGCRTQRRARRLRRARDVVHRPVGHQAVQRRARRRQRHGRPGRAEAVRAAALQGDDAVLRHRRHVSRTTRPTRSSKRTAATSSSAWSRRRPTSASPGTATPIAASSSTAPASSSPATSSRRCWPRPFLIKHPGAKIVYDVRASYAVKDIVAKYGGTALMNRVGHAFFKRRMREEEGDLRRRGHRPLLLPRQLLRRQRLHPGAADSRADVDEGPDAARAAGAAARRSTSSPARSTPRSATCAWCRQKLDGARREVHATGNAYTLDGFSVEFPDWHFNVRASNTEPMLRLNLEATTQELMEREARRGSGVDQSLTTCDVLDAC